MPDPQHIWFDGQNRPWSCAVTVNTVKRVRQRLAMDLLRVFDGQLLTQLADDAVLLVNTLYVVCQPQAEERGVSEEDFGELLVGDTIADAADALVQGIIGFFPPGRRTALTRLWAKTKGLDQAATDLMQAKIDSEQVNQLVTQTLDHASQQFDRQIAAELEKLTREEARGSGNGSGNWPASSVSTQAP